jgi:hypothetical protein
MEEDMKKMFAMTAVCALLATPVFAQDKKQDEAPATAITAQDVELATEAIYDLTEDKAKVTAYCAIIAEEDAVEVGDTAAAEAVRKKLSAFLGGLGEHARMAFNIDETIDPMSEEAQQLGGAFLKLEEACASANRDDG